MPYVEIKLIEEVFDADQKRAMIEKVTEAMVDVEGENMRGVTFVVVEVHDHRGCPRGRRRSARLTTWPSWPTPPRPRPARSRQSRAATRSAAVSASPTTSSAKAT